MLKTIKLVVAAEAGDGERKNAELSLVEVLPGSSRKKCLGSASSKELPPPCSIAPGPPLQFATWGCTRKRRKGDFAPLRACKRIWSSLGKSQTPPPGNGLPRSAALRQEARRRSPTSWSELTSRLTNFCISGESSAGSVVVGTVDAMARTVGIYAETLGGC